jgi:3-phenylpropionate/trans-cinnamate dioxygenase ferredoxin subunit
MVEIERLRDPSGWRSRSAACTTYREEVTVSDFVRVLKVEDVPAGTKKPVEVNGKSILVCNPGDRLLAISNICSHAEEKLECGRMSKTWIACPVHGARFELATGRAMNPPATQPIATYETRVVDGWIEVLA